MFFDGIPPELERRVREFRFLEFEYPGGHSSRQKELVKRWLREERRKYPFLVLYGNPGTGKTMTALKVALKLGRFVFVKHSELDVVFSALSPADRLTTLMDLSDVELLVFDDFGVFYGTVFSTANLYLLFDRRYVARRPTIITTNLNVRGSSGGVEHLDRIDRHFELVCDRIRELGWFVEFDYPSLRDREVYRQALEGKIRAVPGVRGGEEFGL